MREVPHPTIQITRFHRITPAYAGSTITMRPEARPAWDHPRVCGKYLFCLPCIVYTLGSPPRMREVRTCIFQGGQSNRITPAYAGSTNKYLLEGIKVMDHPRVCGKYIAYIGHLLSPTGSPPRMREVLVLPTLYCICFRITPAYAGST